MQRSLHIVPPSARNVTTRVVIIVGIVVLAKAVKGLGANLLLDMGEISGYIRPK
jgi:hypothetical protein